MLYGTRGSGSSEKKLFMAPATVFTVKSFSARSRLWSKRELIGRMRPQHPELAEAKANPALGAPQKPRGPWEAVQGWPGAWAGTQDYHRPDRRWHLWELLTDKGRHPAPPSKVPPWARELHPSLCHPAPCGCLGVLPPLLYMPPLREKKEAFLKGQFTFHGGS